MKKILILMAFMLAGMVGFTQVIEPFVTANKVQLDSTDTDSIYGSFWIDGTELKIYHTSTWNVVGSGGGGDTTYWDFALQRLTAKADVTSLEIDTVVTTVLLADGDGGDIYEWTVEGQFYADSLYTDTTLLTSMDNLGVAMIDTTTGIIRAIHPDSVGGGGVDYLTHTGGDIYPTTATDNIWAKDSVFIGIEEATNAVITFYEANYAARTFQLANNAGHLVLSNAGSFRIGINTSNSAAMYYYNTPTSGQATFRSSATNNYGFGGAYTAPEIIVNGVWETQTDTSFTKFGGSIIKATGIITDNDATPDVNGADIWTYAGSANAVTITDLDNPIVGATYTIIGNSDTYTITINDAGNFNIAGNWVGGLDDNITIYIQADNDYIELVGRVNN